MRARQLREHRVGDLIGERSMLDAADAGIDGVLDVACVAGVHGRRQLLPPRFVHDGAEHREVHPREQVAGPSALEHRLDRIDAACLQIADLRPRFVGTRRCPHELLERLRLLRSRQPREVLGAVPAFGREERSAHHQLRPEHLAVAHA